MIRKFLITFFVMNVSVLCWAQTTLESNGLSITIDGEGKIISLKGDSEMLPPNTASYLIRLETAEGILLPRKVEWNNDVGTFDFDKGIKVEVLAKEKKEYLTFEVTRVSKTDIIDVLYWGPFATSIDETIGEYVGVVRDKNYAIGFQSLNPKTTGGKKLNEDGSDEARGTTATKETFGAALQGYCVNRDKKRVHNIWNSSIENAVIPKNPDGKLVGSAIALFGTEPTEVLNTLEQIELGEGLPHVTLNGEWVKRSRDANKPYLITTFTEENIDQLLDYCEVLGYNALYHGHPFKNWGKFDLIEKQFPNGWDGMKTCVEKANKRGIRLGVHTLTNFITTNDPYVTPIPHDQLMTFSESMLDQDLSADDTEVIVVDGERFKKQHTTQAIRIGDEIIRFQSVSEEAPYTLTNCKRGAYGTTATAHKKGEKVARLADHGYKTLFPTFELQKEMINRLADFFNYTGVSQMDFDGHEGGWGTGEGEFGMDYFSDELVKKVKHELRNGSSRSNHYYWHVNSYLNWGEPWYGGFTKSQGHYRYENQALLKRNYTPNMLGWFLLNPTTTLEEFEYMLARSAGYDAGYALYSNPKSFEKNKEFEAIAAAIKLWEEARLNRIFSETQLKLLKDVNKDFSLSKKGDDYLLTHYKKETFELLNEMVQPGQPNDTELVFDSPQASPVYLVIGAVGESGMVANIEILFNGFETLNFEANLKPNWYLTYRGGDSYMIYDDKGRFKTKRSLGVEKMELTKGSNSIRVSAEFDEGEDIKISGYIRSKDRTETIQSQ